jgi:hypothetical protein
LFSIQRLSTSQRREIIFHLAQHELRYLFIGLLILFITSSLFLFYVINSEEDEFIQISIDNFLIDVCSGIAFLASLLILKSKKEKYDKSFAFLAFGLGLWFCAELIYSYYSISCQGIAYPTIADLFWAAGYFFIGMHLYKTFRVWNEAKRVKSYSIIIALVISAVLVGNHVYQILIAQETGSVVGPYCFEFLQQFPISATVFDFSYFPGDGIILIPALVILFNLRIRDPFFLHRILISAAIIIIFIGDILFIDYAGNYKYIMIWPIIFLTFVLPWL